MNSRRGHESRRHLEAKERIVSLFDESFWSVFIEQRYADIVVLHCASGLVVGVEVESSPRNVLRNIERNLENGCNAVAVVSLTERYLCQITSKIRNHLAGHEIKKIRVFTYDEFGLTNLNEWIFNMARQRTRYLNHFLNNHKPKENNQ